MKVLCNACEAAEAKVMCCADEAALCYECDERVHAANKLAGKHLRIPLISSESTSDGAAASPSVPKCDICQESSGYFFCLEDRAVLCRNCDITIHSANSHVSAHQRFLLTGVQVGLESTQNPTPNPTPIEKEKPPPVPPSWNEDFNTMTGTAGSKLPHNWPVPVFGTQQFSSDFANKSVPKRSAMTGTTNKIMPGGSLFGGNTPDWPLDEFFGFREYNNSGFGFSEHNSSKADSGKLGSSESSSMYRSNDEEMDENECMGQVPEISSWTVPELPSPPTSSGLHWPRDLQFYPSPFDNLASVPDISSSLPRKSFDISGRVKTRRRRY